VISAPLLVILSLGALSASLALLLAHLQFPLAADLLAVSAAIFGLLAVLTAGVSTVRRARQLPAGPRRR
jgi:predicted Na+-dependent transporter